MQTYTVGELTLVVNDTGMVPVGNVSDTHTDLLMEFGDVQFRYDRRMGFISGSGFTLEYGPDYNPMVTVVHLKEPGKPVADMKVLAVLKPAPNKLH